jgi:hypothetical protein
LQGCKWVDNCWPVCAQWASPASNFLSEIGSFPPAWPDCLGGGNRLCMVWRAARPTRSSVVPLGDSMAAT